jgi:hypothetical protein
LYEEVQKNASLPNLLLRVKTYNTGHNFLLSLQHEKSKIFNFHSNLSKAGRLFPAAYLTDRKLNEG